MASALWDQMQLYNNITIFLGNIESHLLFIVGKLNYSSLLAKALWEQDIIRWLKIDVKKAKCGSETTLWNKLTS